MLDLPCNRIAQWFDEDLERTEFLWGRFCDFRFAPHFHEGYAIGIIESGGQRFRPERRSSLIMPKGSLCAINPGVVHEGRSDDVSGWSYRMFYPSVALVSRATEALAGLRSDGYPTFSSYVIDDPRLFAAFAMLHRELSGATRPPRLERESRVLLFLEALVGRHAMRRETAIAVPRDIPAVRRIREVLHARWNSSISTLDLARETALSETHAIRLFSRHVGLPPHAYLIALRVERAKQAIRRGMPLGEAAVASGFYDQSQMTRHFTRLVGVTPGRYAAATR